LGIPWGGREIVSRKEKITKKKSYRKRKIVDETLFDPSLSIV